MSLYIEVKVWKRVSDSSAIRYACFHDVTSHRYVVQSADFFRLPLQKQQVEDFDKQFAELFIGNPLTERSDWFDSLEAAIAAHDRDFA
jgi:hypothetical protein